MILKLYHRNSSGEMEKVGFSKNDWKEKGTGK